jgi:HK97 family phage prohead protease
MKKETRFLNTEFRIEKREDGGDIVRGHAAVFDSLSENLGGFREKIDKGAFDEVLDNDVRALFNHDSNIVLGRTRSNTLRLGVDSKGLTYDYDDPDTTQSRDLLKLMVRGDVSQSSFGFTVDEDKWEEDADGRIIRTIVKVNRLFDVSPVTFPAYPDTDVAKRSLEEWREENKEDEKIEEDVFDTLEYYEKMNDIQSKL